MYTPTIHDKLAMLHRLLDATENSLVVPESTENAAMQLWRHRVALMNLQQLTDLSREVERDLAAALINDATASSIDIQFDTPIGLDGNPNTGIHRA
jgi:hypothetical protein